MNLKNQRRLAAEILKVGEGRVRIDPNRIEDVETAITREDIRRLIHENVIHIIPENGVSRSRARRLREKKKKGRRSGMGRTTSKVHATISKKQAWIMRIRPLRKRLREYKTVHAITQGTYRRLYNMAGSGMFTSVSDMDHHIENRSLWRRR